LIIALFVLFDDLGRAISDPASSILENAIFPEWLNLPALTGHPALSGKKGWLRL